MSKLRFDQIVQELFPEISRSKVKSLIEKGKVEIFSDQWRELTKPGIKFDLGQLNRESVRIVEDEELQYVSRGALKIKKAVEHFSLDINDSLCLDVGLSTGGFTDYLLQSGAKRILGVDVGRDQLHPKLREDERVIFKDKVNAKEPLSEDLMQEFFGHLPEKKFDFIVVDVSFISLEQIIPNLPSLLKPSGYLICLVKPQSELTKGDLNKKGVVKEGSRAQFALEKILGVLTENKLEILGTCPSPIEGENGNKEFLVVSHHP